MIIYMYTKILKILVILIVILGAILFLFKGIIFMISPTLPKISLNQTSVVKQIQSLNKLETSSFTIEKIIEGGKEKGNLFQDFVFGDSILLIAHGSVVGGFDLSKVSTSSVIIEGTKLKILLPAPEILYSKLDNTQTKVYDRKLGFLTKGDKDLESQVRQVAEESIRQAACQEGVLDQASINIRQQFSALFLNLGFTEVSFEIPQIVECK